MKKSVFLFIFFIIVIFLINITNIKAEEITEEKYILVGCDDMNNCSYNLNEETLPNGITWNNDTNTLTLDNYNGGSIYTISDQDININLENKNTITINNELNYGIKINNYILTITSNEDGILIINNTNQNKTTNGIINDKDIVLESGNIYLNLNGNSNYKGIVCDDLSITNESSLFMNIKTTSEDDQYAIYNSTSVSMDTIKEIKINLNNHLNGYIYNVGPLNYEQNNYIGTFLENSKNSNVYLAYKTSNNINTTGENGSINLSKTIGSTGEEITFTITPNDYYEFKDLKFYNKSERDITEEITYNKETNTFNMPPYEITIKPTFIPKVYNLAKDAILNGSFEVTNKAIYGDIIKLNINPNEGYIFSKVNIKNSFTGTDVTTMVNFNKENYTFTMPGFDININVYLEKKDYKITKISSENGTYKINDINDNEVNIKYLSKVRITSITPNENYSTINYDIDILSEQDEVVTDLVNFNPYEKSFIMPNYNIKIKIVFSRINYKIFKNITAGGTFSCEEEASAGQKVKISYKPNDNYILKSIVFYDYIRPSTILNIDIDLNNNTFIMPKNFVTIKVTFTKKPTIPSVKTTLYGYDDVKVSWDKVPDADGYYVYYKKSTAESYTYAGKTTNTYYKKANLYDGTLYYFKVKAFIKDINNNEYQSYKTSSIYSLKKVSTPFLVKYSENYILIDWLNIYGESGYQISRSISLYGTYIIKNISSSHSRAVLKTTRNKRYYYKVRAYKLVNNIKIYGPWSYVKGYTLR